MPPLLLAIQLTKKVVRYSCTTTKLLWPCLLAAIKSRPAKMKLISSKLFPDY
jgi:hypothetical protein